MSKKRKVYSSKRKAEIAIEAIKESTSQSQLASRYSVHPSQIKTWKQEGIVAVEQCFSKQQERQAKENDKLLSKLYEEIGDLHTQLSWLKKKHKMQH